MNSYRDFKNLPILDKKNYLQKYKFADLFVDGKLPPVVHASSGSSGQPTFWFRTDEQEEHGGQLHEKIFREIFKIQKSDSTLIVICFSMGVWIAGGFTLTACRYLAKKGYRLSVVTPGIEKLDIINILEHLAPQFKNLILAGYPPFIMDMVLEAKRCGIEVNPNIKFLTAGDKFSEKWREALFRELKIKKYYNSLVNIYGSADIGIMGFETPLSIALKKMALQNPRIHEYLFKNEETAPTLVQYDPKEIFIESINGELVFTAKTGIPLVRYNIHDLGWVIPYEEMMTAMKDLNVIGSLKKYLTAEFRMPFLVKTNRTDVAVTFYALNIYPENIQSALKDSRIGKLLSGNFSAYNISHRQKYQKLYFKLELAKNITKLTRKQVSMIDQVITEHLLKNNIEYRKLHSTIGKAAIPKMIFTKLGHSIQPKIQGLINIQGKKPKLTIVA